MPTITVKLDKRRADRLARRARRRKVAKSDVIHALIDRAGPIDTGDDLIEWIDAAVGGDWDWLSVGVERPALLDSSYLIDPSAKPPLTRAAPRHAVISAAIRLQRRASRRLGENDAWLVATAQAGCRRRRCGQGGVRAIG